MKRTLRLIQYTGIFLKELFVANFQIAKLILSPKLNFKSAAIKFHSKMKTPAEMVLITNSITLTPGTLVMDADLEKGTILVHVMAVDNIDDIMRDLKRFPEDKALYAMRGEQA